MGLSEGSPRGVNVVGVGVPEEAGTGWAGRLVQPRVRRVSDGLRRGWSWLCLASIVCVFSCGLVVFRLLVPCLGSSRSDEAAVRKALSGVVVRPGERDWMRSYALFRSPSPRGCCGSCRISHSPA